MNFELRITIFSFLLTLCFSAVAQSSVEAKINSFFDMAQKAESNEQIMALNDSICTTLNATIKNTDFLENDLGNCPFIGSIYTSDLNYKIYTWNLPLLNGAYVYGGLIQTKDGSTTSLIANKAYKPTERQILSTKNWYGALYYQAIAVKQKKNTYYVLLGWLVNNELTQAKVIDVLKTDRSGRFIFGNAFFYNEKKQTLSRIVFEYSAQCQMTLKYESKTKRIVFDHLSPSSPSMKGIYSEYGPDFTYDAYTYKKKKWTFSKNNDARNEQ